MTGLPFLSSPPLEHFKRYGQICSPVPRFFMSSSNWNFASAARGSSPSSLDTDKSSLEGIVFACRPVQGGGSKLGLWSDLWSKPSDPLDVESLSSGSGTSAVVDGANDKCCRSWVVCVWSPLGTAESSWETEEWAVECALICSGLWPLASNGPPDSSEQDSSAPKLVTRAATETRAFSTITAMSLYVPQVI